MFIFVFIHMYMAICIRESMCIMYSHYLCMCVHMWLACMYMYACVAWFRQIYILAYIHAFIQACVSTCKCACIPIYNHVLCVCLRVYNGVFSGVLHTWNFMSILCVYMSVHVRVCTCVGAWVCAILPLSFCWQSTYFYEHVLLFMPLFTSLNVCLYLCLFTCRYLSLCMHMHLCVCVCVYGLVYTFVHAWRCVLHLHMWLCKYVCMCAVCIYGNLDMYTQTHIHRTHHHSTITVVHNIHMYMPTDTQMSICIYIC